MAIHGVICYGKKVHAEIVIGYGVPKFQVPIQVGFGFIQFDDDMLRIIFNHVPAGMTDKIIRLNI